MPFSPEEAAAGREAGLAEINRRKALKRDDPDKYIQELFKLNKAQLVEALMDAALGKGDYTDLPAEKRLQALFKANEYVVGKSTTEGKASEGPGPAHTGIAIQ